MTVRTDTTSCEKSRAQHGHLQLYLCRVASSGGDRFRLGCRSLVERLIAPRKRSLAKGDTYECGVKTYGETWVRFRIQYYIYALMFVVFDIETVFLFPWAVSYAGLGVVRARRDDRVPGDPRGRPGLCLGQGRLAVGLIGGRSSNVATAEPDVAEDGLSLRR